MNMTTYKVYSALVTELAELTSRGADTTAIDAVRFAAQVCGNVIATETDEEGNLTHTMAERELYKAHLQFV